MKIFLIFFEATENEFLLLHSLQDEITMFANLPDVIQLAYLLVFGVESLFFLNQKKKEARWYYIFELTSTKVVIIAHSTANERSKND